MKRINLLGVNVTTSLYKKGETERFLCLWIIIVLLVYKMPLTKNRSNEQPEANDSWRLRLEI